MFKIYEKDEVLSEDEHISNLQWAFIENCSADFVGRKTLVSQIISKINSTNSGIIGIVGKPGSGKTALMVGGFIFIIETSVLDRTIAFQIL